MQPYERIYLARPAEARRAICSAAVSYLLRITNDELSQYLHDRSPPNLQIL